MRFILLLTLSLQLSQGLLAVGPDQPPYYVKMKGFKVKTFNRQKIELASTAVFYNTYNAKAKIQEIEIDVYLEDQLLGKVSQAEVVNIPKQSAFDVPLLLTLEPPGAAVKNAFWQSGRFIFGRKVNITYKGFIKLKALGFIPVKIPMEEKIQVSLQELL